MYSTEEMWLMVICETKQQNNKTEISNLWQSIIIVPAVWSTVDTLCPDW